MTLRLMWLWFGRFVRKQDLITDAKFQLEYTMSKFSKYRITGPNSQIAMVVV